MNLYFLIAILPYVFLYVNSFRSRNLFLINIPNLKSSTIPDLDTTMIDNKPKWAAGGYVQYSSVRCIINYLPLISIFRLVSDIVNALISFKPLFSIMKIAARNTLINTATSNGIPWRERAIELGDKNLSSLVN